MHPSIPFNLDTVISVLDHLIANKVGKHLNTLQRNIIRGVWEASTYEEIAKQSRWSEAHVKSVGANLWGLISDVLDESVNKKNFRATVERLYPKLLSLNEPMLISSSVTAISVLESPHGPVKLTSSFYCDRPPIENRCYEAIIQPGALIRIRAPRHMGKTSLLDRIVQKGKELGYVAVFLNLQLVDSHILQDLDRFLRWFCARVSHQLELPPQLSDYWDDIFGSKTSCKDYFENYLLPQCQHPLVLALDNVDTLFAYPETADSFFSLLRAWYEDGKNNLLWQNLRLVLVHSTDVYISLNINQSPFNVGLPIELPEFKSEQVMALARQHGLDLTKNQIDQLMDLLGGHPYLVRLVLYHLAQPNVTFGALIGSIQSFNSPLYGHLHELTIMLDKQPELVMALKAILTNSSIPLTLNELFQLTHMGLITTKKGQIQIRCELYRQWLTAFV